MSPTIRPAPRASGHSWPQIARTMGVSVGKAFQTYVASVKNSGCHYTLLEPETLSKIPSEIGSESTDFSGLLLRSHAFQ